MGGVEQREQGNNKEGFHDDKVGLRQVGDLLLGGGAEEEPDALL